MSQATNSAPTEHKSGLIFVYWIIVAIPLVWGVSNSINSSLPLFGGTSAYIPWVIGAPPKPASSPAAKPTPVPAVAPTATAAPTVTPAATNTPTPNVAPTPAASPFSTPEPSATVGPITTTPMPQT